MKKVVITAFDIRTARQEGRSSISVPEGALVTPQAIDDARAYGISIMRGVLASRPVASMPSVVPSVIRGAVPDVRAAGPRSAAPLPAAHGGADMVEEVRRRLLALLGDAAPASLDAVIRQAMAGVSVSAPAAASSFVRKAGGTVQVVAAAIPVAENNGASGGVGMVEAVPPGQNHPGVAYMRWENASFSWTFPHAEVLVVLEGELGLETNGVSLTGVPGDSFLVPAGDMVVLSAKGRVRCMHSSWPEAGNRG